ncbi:MAG: alpha/beta hydrolase [Gammaproteobacteria bacterium]|nr:alpha/beta hydrolase [Gammaproteobacteria bacterium]
MPKIKVNDINLYYEERGVGPAIIFVGGFSADHSVWNAMVKQYFGSYRVIVFDNRGAGSSDCPDVPYTAEMLADDVAGLCKALNIENAHFVGSSMGGHVVMTLAHLFPNLVKSMVILNSVMKLENFGREYQLYLDAVYGLLQISDTLPYNTVVEIYTKSNIGWIFSNKFLNRPGMVEELIEARKRSEFPMTKAKFRNQRNVSLTFDASSWVSEIECPCLVIASDADSVYPPSAVKKVADSIPNAKYCLINGDVGHLPFIEEPARVAREIKTFLAEIRE